MSSLDILCRHCGYSGNYHGGPKNPVRPYACPAGPEPKWPRSVKDDKRAGEIYDRRLHKHWSKRKTSYEPVAR